MNLIFYTHALVAGGAERVWVDLANGFVRSGALVEFVVDRNASENLARLDPAVSLTVLGGGHLRNVARLSRLIRLRKPDALLSALAISNLKAVAAAAAAGALDRTIVTYHGFAESETQPLSTLAWRLTPALTRLAAATVVVSDGLRDHLTLRWRAPQARTTRIYNPVADLPFTAPDRAALSERPCVALVVGRLDANKNVADALRAFAEVPLAEAELIVVGDGPDRPTLEALAERLGLAKRVRFAGYQPSAAPWYANARCLVLSSRSEAFGLVIVEALANGLAVVATDSAGPREILAGGRYGELVPIGDIGAMAQSLSAALADPGEPPPRAERARDFSLDKALARYSALIASLPRRTG